MAGIETEYGGEAWAAEGVSIGYLEQEPKLEASLNVGENVALAFGPLRAAIDRFNAISLEFAEPMDDDRMTALLAEQATLQEQIEAGDGWELDRRIEIALDALGCPPAEASVDTLSGGERRRVALCRLLLEKPDILLLDEPTNHLDAESVAWLERTLRDYAGTVMVITHDRYFLDNVTNWILEIERGRGYPFEGNYSSWLGAEAQAAGSRRRRKRAHGSARWRPSRNGSPRQPARAPDQEQAARASPNTRRCWPKRPGAELGRAPPTSSSQPGPRLGGTVIEADAAAQGATATGC